MAPSMMWLLPFVMLAALKPVIAQKAGDTYSQKIDCMPFLDGCADDYGDYDPPATSYLQNRLGPGIGLGFACILLCCIVWYFFCCCRCWAKCCGCCRMALCQCCCGAGIPIEEQRYSKCQRLSLVGALIFAICLCVCGMGLGIRGGQKTYDGATDLLTQAITSVNQMDDLNKNVAKTGFIALTNFYSTGGDVNYDDAAVSEAVTTVRDHINDFKKIMNDNRDFFDYGCYGFYALFILTALIGVLAWICGWGPLSMCVGITGAVLFFVVWFLFAIFYGTGVFLDDTCVALSNYYYKDCMLEPGRTCQKDQLTELFQCPDITTVGPYYANAYNLLDTATSNGAGTNAYGVALTSINLGYDNSVASGGHSKAPAGIAVSGNLGFEPYTTCSPTGNNGGNNLYQGATDGNRMATCRSGDTNTGTTGPINSKLTTITGSAGTNPGWSDITCAHACINNTAEGHPGCTPTSCAATNAQGYCTSITEGDCIMDGLTNLGGNLMFRKFVYETATSTYDAAASQGYATCADDIKWKQNEYVVDAQKYQNYSSWMTESRPLCVPTTYCPQTLNDGYSVIEYDATSLTNKAACLQAAAMAATDIMYALSYIGSCEYVKKFSLEMAVQSSGACFTLGDGLLYLFLAQGFIGIAYFIVVFVGISGYRCFNNEKYEENTTGPCDEDTEEVLNEKDHEEHNSVGVAMTAEGGSQAPAGGGPGNAEPFPTDPKASVHDEWV